MNWRLPLVALWIAAGYGVAAGIFWGLLQVPESSVWALGLSASLVLAMVIALLWVTGGVLLAWHPQITPVRAFVSGLSASVAVAAGALLFGAVWWATLAALTWHGAHAGEIDAVIIAQDRRVEYRVAPPYDRLGDLGPPMGARLHAGAVAGGMDCRSRHRGHRRGGMDSGRIHPKRWTVVLALSALCFMLPWRFVYWRPEHLTLSTEPWFVGAKLAAMALVAAIAWALMIRVVTPVSDRAGGRQCPHVKAALRAVRARLQSGAQRHACRPSCLLPHVFPMAAIFHERSFETRRGATVGLAGQGR